MTFGDTLALLTLALPLSAAAAHAANYLTNRRAVAMARIIGMAGRGAAMIGRALASLPPGANSKTADTRLITAAVDAIAREMAGFARTIGATQERLAAIVEGEVAKVVVGRPP